MSCLLDGTVRSILTIGGAKSLQLILISLACSNHLLPPRPTPSSTSSLSKQFSSTHLYSCMDRGARRDNSLAQEHNPMTSVQVWTRTVRSAVHFFNHYLTLTTAHLSEFSETELWAAKAAKLCKLSLFCVFRLWDRTSCLMSLQTFKIIRPAILISEVCAAPHWSFSASMLLAEDEPLTRDSHVQRSISKVNALSRRKPHENICTS